jgi:hypothetical protein
MIFLKAIYKLVFVNQGYREKPVRFKVEEQFWNFKSNFEQLIPQ